MDNNKICYDHLNTLIHTSTAKRKSSFFLH